MFLLLLCISFLACLAATGWSLRLIWRMRDPRLGGLAALLALLCVWHVATAVAVWGTPPDSNTVFRMESPAALTFRGFIAGVSGLAAVAFVSRILAEQRELAARMASGEAEARSLADALRTMNQTLNSLIESSPLAVIVVDPLGLVTSWNPAAARMFGWRAEEVLGRPLPTVPEDQRVCYDTMIREEFAGERRVATEVARIRKDGSTIAAHLWTAPILDAAGRIVATVGMLADISERRRVEGALRDSETRLAHVARLSTMGEMVAGIAHEINQPLYAIANYANACTNTLTHEPERAAEKIPYWTGQIAEQAVRAGEIIRRLRGFAQKASSRRAPLQLEPIVQEALTLVAADLRRHQVDVRLELSPPPPPVLADRVQIQQVLVNLMKNACEALTDANVQYRCVSVRTVSTDDAVEVEVVDNGPGLPDDVNDRIFEAFYTTKADGLGMGLAISRTIVEAHGGRLTARNLPTGGAAVRFTLPRTAQDAGTDVRFAEARSALD